MDGNPIDDILTSTERALGVTFTPEEREQMKAKYKGDAELAFQDMIKSTKKYKNIDFSYKERLDMKSKYKVPLAWVDVMALSENPEMKYDIKNKAGESSAAGYWQVTKVHEPYIKQMFGVSHDDFLKDPNIQERYVTERLEPEYNKNLTSYRNIAAEGIKEGRYKDFENLMVKGKFTDDQIKALNHVLGPEGSAHFLKTGTFLGTNPERKARDVKRTLGEVINIRKKYGVPSFISDQYDFGDVETTASLPAAEDKVEETPAPKGAMPPGLTVSPVIDWSKGTVTNIDPVTKQPIKPTKKEEKPATKIGYVPPPGPSIVNQYQVTTQGESSQNAGEYFQSGVLNKEYIKQQKLLEEQNRNRQEFINANENLKNIGTSYEGYTKPVNEFDLTPEEIKARDEIQQKFTNESTIAQTSEYLLKDQFGEGVIKDIQNVLTNNANYIKTINTLEEKLKAKYKENTPAKIDFGPLAEQKNEISENIKGIGAQINGIESQLDGIQKKLDALDNDPDITPARYNVLNANLVLEYNGLLGKRTELIEKGKILEKDLEGIVAQQNVIINEYNKKIRSKESEFANDPDVKELDRVYNKYKENWSKIDGYKKSPYFDSYLNSISTLTELRDTYKNLFPDKVRGEERANELARLAKDIVSQKKSDYWTPKNALYDIYYGLKSFVADAPAVGVFSTAMNALNSATFNFIGDFLGAASSIADLIGEEETARTLRAGYFATRTRVEQDVAKGAVRSDIVGNPVENYYTVKEKDTPLLGVGFSVGDKIVVEDGAPVLYRDSEDFKLTLLNPNADAVAKDFLKGKENQIERSSLMPSVARTVVSALPSIIDMMSLIGFNYAAIPRISRFITNKGLRTAAGLTANFGAQTFQQYGDTYQSYLDKGQSAPKAAKYAFGQSAGVALIELFNPLEMKIASLGGEAARSQFRKVLDTTVDLYSRGELGTKDFLNSIIMGLAVIPGIEMSKEALTEIVQGIFENHVENFALNENKSYTFNEGLNTTFTTLAVTFIPSMILGKAYYKDAKTDIITSAIYNAAKDPSKFNADILQAVNDGKMDMPTTAGIIDFVSYIKEELDVYENITDEQGAALTGLIGTRYSLENKKKNSNNEVAKKKIDEQIQEINAIIEEVATGKRKSEVDPFVRPLYEEEGDQPEADRVPTKKEFSDVVYATMPKEWQDMSKEEAWKSFQELPVQDQIKFFNTATGKKEEVTAPSTTAAGLTKEQQTELDKVNKRAERIQRTLQEDTEVQEEGDEPLLTAEQKQKLETELQTLNQRRDAIQKQSTAEVPVQSGAEGRQGVGGQVQAKPEGPSRKGEEAKAEVKAEEEVAAPALKDVKSTAEALKGKTEGLLTEPTAEQVIQETKDKNFVTYNFDKESDIPDAFKNKISSRGKVKGKEVIRVTLPKSMADYLLAKDDPQAIAEAYHKAKKDGSNPALVEAVEGLLGAAPTPTPTTTEKAAPEAAEAPQKANTVQGFEITRKDGSKLPASDYTKDKKTGKWKRVAADGTTKGVSFAPYVKQLEDALSSPAAAETKKTEPTPVKEQDIANELAKANNISKTQAKTISAVINTVKKNIAKRLGISLPEYRRRTAIRVVPNLQGIIKDFPNSLSSLRGLSSELINDFTGATQELKVAFQDAFGKVDAKFIKNNGIDNNDFVLSSVLTLDNNGYFDFLGKGKKLSSMKKEAIQEELNKRLSDILDRAKNTNDFYIKEFSNTWLKEAQKRATTELEKEAYQLMIDGNEDALSQQLENIQSQQKANLLASLNYLIPSKDYSPEFKYAVVSMALKGAQAKPITIKGKLIDGKLAKRNDQTVGNHQELSSMVLPNVYAEMQRGSGSHPMELIDKHTDKSIIGRDETWELVKDRVFKKSDGGYWIKFEQSSEDSDIQALTLVSKKVQKVMSADDNPWCTGGGMATAYLPKGDFYLFLNENLDPQITVRYEGDKIAELRGTDKGQALSESQTNIAEKFLDNIPNGKDYKNQVKASRVYHKLNNDIEPTTLEDLKDFFDVWGVQLDTYDDEKIEKFEDLKNLYLNTYIELNEEFKLYDVVKRSDVVYKDDFVTKDFAKEYPNSSLLKQKMLLLGDINFYGFSDRFFPEGLEIKGSARLTGNLELPKNLKIDGSLLLTGEEIPSGFTLPEGLQVGGDLNFERTILPNNFTLPEGLQVGGSLDFTYTTLPEGFTLPKGLKVGWDLNFFKAILPKDFVISEGLQVGRGLFFDDVALPQDFTIPKDVKIKATLNFWKTVLPQGFTLAENLELGGDLYFYQATLPDSFTLPKGLKVGGHLSFSDATLPNGFTLPEDIQVAGGISTAGAKYKNGGLVGSLKSLAQQDSRGAIIETPTSTLMLLDKDNADVTTPIHEIAHEYEKVLTADERKVMEDWSGAKFGTTKFREAFAKGAERYLYEGATFNGKVDAVFEKLKNWFKNVITDAINYFGDINQLTPEVREIYSKMLIDGDMDVVETVAPSPTAAETQVEAEAKTAEQLSADIEADIEAAAAKEQEAMAKAFEGNKKQKAANDLIKNPKSADTLPQDLLEDLYNLAAEAKYTPALKKKCD